MDNGTLALTIGGDQNRTSFCAIPRGTEHSNQFDISLEENRVTSFEGVCPEAIEQLLGVYAIFLRQDSRIEQDSKQAAAQDCTTPVNHVCLS